MNLVTWKGMGRGSGILMALSLILLLAVGCGPSKMAKDQLEKARKTYAQAKGDPKVETLAPIQLADAGKAIQKAEQAGSTTSMLHLSHVAEKRAQIAMSVAEAKKADEDTRKLNAETAELLAQKQKLDMQRELEKKKAELEAEQARLTAAAEAERAAKSKKEAELAMLAAKTEAERAAIAKKEAEQARLAAAADAERAAKAKKEAEQARLAGAVEAEKAAKAKMEAEQARLAAQTEAEKAAKAKADADMLMKELSELKAKQTERGIVLTIGDVLFAFDKADLSPKADRNVNKLADFLKKYPNRNVLIEGHTDSVGSDEYNIGLSQKRSDSVKERLTGSGIDKGRITTVGYGEKYPAVANDTDANRALNRRVEVIILNEGVKAETQIRK